MQLIAILICALLGAAATVQAADVSPQTTLAVALVVSAGDGTTGITDQPIQWNTETFAPPAPPLWTSARVPASELLFVQLPPGWDGDWHPTPQRQYGVMMQGTFDIETGDGTVRRLAPGSVFLLEDTDAPGHRSRVVGTDTVVMMLIAAPAP